MGSMDRSGERRGARARTIASRCMRRRPPTRAIAVVALLAASAGTLMATPAEARFGFVAKWGGEGSRKAQFKSPLGIAIDASGNVYVADTDNNRIQKFTANGRFLEKWGREGSRNGHFETPTDVATDAAGDVYVVDLFNHRVQKFTANGRFLAKWGTSGSADGEFDRPGGIATDAAGNVYVGDYGNSRVQKFTSDGSFVAKWKTSGGYLAGVATDSAGNVYVLDDDQVKKFTANGGLLGRWGGPGSRNGQFEGPTDIATDGAGNVYVVEELGHRVQKFTANGRFLAKWGRRGSRNGQFRSPTGIATDAAGNVYVTSEHRIQKFGEIKRDRRTVTTIPVRRHRAFFEASCTLSTSCRARVLIKAGGRILAQGGYSVPAGKSRTVSLPLTRAGRDALAMRRRVAGRATLLDTRTGKRKTIPVVLRGPSRG